MGRTCRIALAQLAVVDGNKEANLNKMESALKQAWEQSAELLILPELNLTGLVSYEKMKSLAERRDGQSFRLIQKMLKTYPVSVLYSFPEFVSDDEIYITTCLVGANGEALAYYRKTHLYTDENEMFRKGMEWTTVSHHDLSMGLLTCYDIEFPEPARSLALKGIHLLIVNSANMAPYEYIHRLFIQARALENQLFVVYCNRVGANEKYEYHGQSAVVGPDGKIIAEIEADVEAVRMVEISLDDLKNATSVFNYLADRREKLYQ
ncbi:carbon-nitrogen hydrolase family protein [Bacillus sp. BRMEA1]|uniref:carbon-nitrogen hydrolase family protein n=1 Tax=Neobacillus endophyticus TaxID=2738405 RepID=UPI001567645D|nr:carbon-nitrogen hydrolase family protein [Neobacillus endophyticus]NRD77737.1 carbon-nitrogen hydrolase family protein [Neobacillus endophyticus]